MTDYRSIKVYSDLHHWFASEDGKNYRGYSQEMTPVFDRVRYLDDKVNGATKQENPKGWGYLGSTTTAIVDDWCRRNGYTLDQYARNEDNAKTKFRRWHMSRANHKLRAH